MEKFVATKNSKKYGFKKGDEFNILRTITNKYVLIVEDEKQPNIVLSEAKALYYGTITEGKPQLG